MGCCEIKPLPVVAKGKLVGIITSKDVLHVEPSLIELLSFKSYNKRRDLLWLNLLILFN